MKEKYSIREASIRCGWEESETIRFIADEFIFTDEAGLIPWDEYQVLWVARNLCETGFCEYDAWQIARPIVREALFHSDCS